MTTPHDIADLMKCTSDKMVKMLIAKGTDYSGDQDTFVNFKLSASITGVPTEKTILVRMSDKISRLGGLLDRPALVANEGIEDTLDDLIGYCVLMKGYLMEKAEVESNSYAVMDDLTDNDNRGYEKELYPTLEITDPVLDEETPKCKSKYAYAPHRETGAD